MREARGGRISTAMAAVPKVEDDKDLGQQRLPAHAAGHSRRWRCRRCSSTSSLGSGRSSAMVTTRRQQRPRRVGAGEKGIWGEGEWRTEWGARGQVGEGTEAPQGGGILIASAVTPTSWSGRDCSVAGARSREQWRRKATEGVQGWAGLACPRLSGAGRWSRPGGFPFSLPFLL